MASLNERPAPRIVVAGNSDSVNSPAGTPQPLDSAEPPEARLVMISRPFEFWSIKDLIVPLRRRLTSLWLGNPPKVPT
jgi:hypothetical protein